MSHLVVWQNLVFVIPLVVAAALVVSALSGVTDFDVAADVDADVDADAEAEMEHGSGGVLTLLGLGRAPLVIILMSLLSLFGGTGLAARAMLAPLVGSGTLSALVAGSLAAVIAFFGTAALARSVGRHLPATETYANHGEDLVGALGTVEVRVTEEFGVAHVTDTSGTFHQIRCRSDEGAISRGVRVMVTDFDPDRAVHTVTRSPV